jgi:hypothetical protein
MTEQKSISSAVFGLQDSLRSLEQKLTCLQPKSTETQDTNNKSKPNGIILFDTLVGLGPNFSIFFYKSSML